MKFVIDSIGQTITIIHAVADLGLGEGRTQHGQVSQVLLNQYLQSFKILQKNTNSLIFLCSLAFSPAFQGRVGTCGDSG